MNPVVAIVFLASCALALPPYKQPIPAPYKPADHKAPQMATILQQDYNQESTGNYNFGYQTSDGVKREEKAEVKNPGTENEVLVIQGSFSYIDQNGVTYKVTYVADENGYRPTGQHIPSA